MQREIEFMKMAIAEAQKCQEEQGRNSIPPKVGVVVVKDGRVLATAYRGELKPGEHAEYTVLERKLATENVAGATVYCTLEPCTTRNHPKRPCAEWLIRRKVSSVVFAMLDPNPKIQGHGERALRDAGIDVQRFDKELADQVEEINRQFIIEQTGKHGQKHGSKAPPSPWLLGPLSFSPRQWIACCLLVMALLGTGWWCWWWWQSPCAVESYPAYNGTMLQFLANRDAHRDTEEFFKLHGPRRVEWEGVIIASAEPGNAYWIAPPESDVAKALVEFATDFQRLRKGTKISFVGVVYRNVAGRSELDIRNGCRLNVLSAPP